MFAHDRGWVRRLREAVDDRPDRRGGRRAGPVRHARPHAAPDRSLSARPAARPRRPRQPAAAPAHRPGPAPRREQLPDDAIVVARSMGPAELLDYDRKRLRGLVLEEGGPDQPRRDRGAGARHRRGRADRQRHRSASIPAMRSSSTARRATCTFARPPTSRRPMSRRCGCARAGRRSISRCATFPASPATASASP